MTPVLNQANPVHTLSVSSWYISVLSFHSSLGRPTGLHHSGFLIKTQYEFLLSPIHAYTLPTRFIFRDFITLKIGGKKYKSRKRSLCNFLLVLLFLLLMSKYFPQHPAVTQTHIHIHTHTHTHILSVFVLRTTIHLIFINNSHHSTTTLITYASLFTTKLPMVIWPSLWKHTLLHDWWAGK